MGPRAPRCDPREARMPQRAPRWPQRRPQGSHFASKMGQDSLKRRPGGAKSDERELQDAKREMLILAWFFPMKMRSWRVCLGSFWAHVEVMCAHLGDLRRSWSTWTEILEDLGQQEAARGR